MPVSDPLDLIIIGGGIGGVIGLHYAKKAGLKVLLLERQRVKRQNPLPLGRRLERQKRLDADWARPKVPSSTRCNWFSSTKGAIPFACVQWPLVSKARTWRQRVWTCRLECRSVCLE